MKIYCVTCPLSPLAFTTTNTQLRGPFGRQKEPRRMVCVIGRNLTWAAASARFPGRRFHQVSRHEIRNRAAPETMGQNDNVAYVVIPCERTRERLPSHPYATGVSPVSDKKPACHFSVCVALRLFLSFSRMICVLHTPVTDDRWRNSLVGPKLRSRLVIIRARFSLRLLKCQYIDLFATWVQISRLITIKIVRSVFGAVLLAL